MNVKLRYIIALGVIAFVIGGAVWVYDNADEAMATGEGGLPLIRASTDPVKLPPEEPGGEVMPHADSTVFAAISSDPAEDPSMEGLKLPEPAEQAPSADFAGLRTGFAVPAAPEPKVESLFSGETIETGSGKYVSGIAPEAIAEAIAPVAEPAVEPAIPAEPVVEAAPEPEPETKIEPVAAPEPVAEQKPEPVAEVPAESVQEPVVAAPVVTQDAPGETAQALEAQEKAMIRPSSKPTPPTARKEPVPESVKEKATEAPTEAPAKPVAQAPVREIEVASAPVPPSTPLSTPVRSATGMAPIREDAPAVQAVPSSGDGYVIQLSSTPSQADAERSWMQMQSMYPDQLRGLKPSYKSVEVPGKGTFVRLRAGTLGRDDANARCSAIRQIDPRGGGCLVIRE